MANIGATTAFYKVETSLTKANNEVSKSMERLATGKQNASAGDRSSYVAMADTFRLDFVGTKAGIKGANVVMGYLETAMRTLDGASALLSRLQELAVLGANQTNTTEDANAIDAEAEAIADELHRLMSTAKYKGADLFKSAANGMYVSLGGRNANMTFGIQKVDYNNLYNFEGSGTNITTGAALENGKYYIVTQKGTSSTELTNVGATTGDVGEVFLSTGTPTLADQATDNIVQVVTYDLKKKPSDGADSTTDDMTSLIETVQNRINTARVQAGSQYAALESAVNYITDLTAQYELGYNTVNDVNFSMETAHLAKNQILQQAATAMLAQANSGQQSLLQLIAA